MVEEASADEGDGVEVPDVVAVAGVEAAHVDPIPERFRSVVVWTTSVLRSRLPGRDMAILVREERALHTAQHLYTISKTLTNMHTVVAQS